MVHPSAIKTDAILPFTTAWMDLEGIVHREMSQTEKETPDDFSHLWNTKSKQNKWTNEKAKTNTWIQRTEECLLEGKGGVWNGKGGSTVYDEWKVNFWWWAHYSVYRSRNIILLTWNLYNVIKQCYLNQSVNPVSKIYICWFLIFCPETANNHALQV